MSVKNVATMWFYYALPALCFNTRRSVTLSIEQMLRLPCLKEESVKYEDVDFYNRHNHSKSINVCTCKSANVDVCIEQIFDEITL